MIRGGTIHTTPDLIAKACRRRTDVGMAVMPIDAPCTKHTFHVAIVAWASDMIHDLVATVFDDGCTDFGGECIHFFYLDLSDLSQLLDLLRLLRWYQGSSPSVGATFMVARGWGGACCPSILPTAWNRARPPTGG